MKAVALVALGILLTLSGLAVAASISSGVVVSTITYIAGETRPLTLNTSGELRVTCN